MVSSAAMWRELLIVSGQESVHGSRILLRLFRHRRVHSFRLFAGHHAYNEGGWLVDVTGCFLLERSGILRVHGFAVDKGRGGMAGTNEKLSAQEAIRSYVAAWNTANQASRDALLEHCWAEDAPYADPQVEAQGRSGISSIIAAYHSHRPDFVLAIDGSIDAHHSTFRFVWSLTDGEGILKGMEFGTVQQGLIESVTRFFGALPETS